MLGLIKKKMKNKSVLFLLFLLYSASAFGEEFVYDSAKKRDPFVPLVTKDGRYLYGMPSIDIEKGGNVIVLEGILKDSKRAYFAIINGEMVKEGDKIMGLDVVEIKENMVKLSKDGEEKTYKLTEEGGGLFEKKNAD